MAHTCMNGGLPADILCLICDQLVGDRQTLARLGRVSQSWRIFSLPFLLKHVDLSCHNNGRVPDPETTGPNFPVGTRVVMADFSDEYRPRNLVPHQRAFLRFMIDRPELATHVKALTWTLVWRDFGEENLLEIDKCTWEVFRRMQNVVALDLASLHQIGDEPYIRQNPAKLFPAVTDLRLVGWMHRGLVKAIIMSLDPTKLRCLTLHHLQDEGAMPSVMHGPNNGQPMPLPENLAITHGHQLFYGIRRVGIPHELWGRQDKGKAAIYPGHMWLPLRLLRKMPLASLTDLRISLSPFSTRNDERSDYEVFLNAAQLIQSVKDTVEVIVISLGQDLGLHYDTGDREFRRQAQVMARYTPYMQVGRAYKNLTYRRRCYRLTRDFFHRLALVVNMERFPHLTRVELRGFGILEHGASGLQRPPDFEATRELLRGCLFVDKDLVKVPNIDYRSAFTGYAYSLPDMEQARIDELKAILRES